MATYEYKVVAAPRKPKAFKGVKSLEDQFATVLAELMNKMARDEWEYLRAESLPCEERTGLTGRVESYQSVLVFRRRIRAGQKFFEVPPTKQIELHDEPEDATEHDIVFASSHRQATVTPLHEAPTEVGTKAGVLGILRNRKARMMQQEAGEAEETKMAAE